MEIFLADRASRLPRVIKVALSVFMIGATAMMLMFSAVYLKGGLDSHPLTISHRGVDAGNGVQNTIPALQKTAKEHPDYVEMDLHETRDHQFVVLHDENLQELAGVNKAPRELTLAQLQRLTVRENGHHAKLASFDAYLAAAARLHQKLIVEIKTTSNDSKGMLQRFIAKYAATLVKHGDRVHSMNYQVVTTLRRQVPDLYTSLILRTPWWHRRRTRTPTPSRKPRSTTRWSMPPISSTRQSGRGRLTKRTTCSRCCSRGLTGSSPTTCTCSSRPSASTTITRPTPRGCSSSATRWMILRITGKSTRKQ